MNQLKIASLIGQTERNDRLGKAVTISAAVYDARKGSLDVNVVFTPYDGLEERPLAVEFPDIAEEFVAKRLRMLLISKYPELSVEIIRATMATMKVPSDEHTAEILIELRVPDGWEF